MGRWRQMVVELKKTKGSTRHFYFHFLLHFPPFRLRVNTNTQTDKHTHTLPSSPPSSFLSALSRHPPPPWETQCSVTVVVPPGSCGGDSGSSVQRLE